MNQTIKNDNKKALKKYLLIFVVAAFVGGILGGLSESIGEQGLEMIKETVLYVLIGMNIYAIPAVIVICMIPSLIVYIQCKRLYQNGNAEDDVLDEIEDKLNIPMLLTNVGVILSLFFFSTNTILEKDDTKMMIAMIFFFLSVALGVLIQQKVVDLTKAMNPEKQGSVYDYDFAKKWEASCDEAQRLMIYKASYSAFKVTNVVCISLWVVLQILAMAFGTGILPIVVVLIIYMAMLISYIVTAAKLERG